ncbi:uncharacterized protein MONOS_18269 [Monocercomonoides exilis]|uniref:uncharacterized protein n=1 Tax=Monocercomonoides exilis TaxID=2049356 RepID=UPI003559F4E3|nr:hypothetical protein MONOS_18269 [Monocercomonoides exilis]
MDNFHKDILRFGSIVGFRHFQFYLRGREELVVTIIFNSPSTKEEIREAFLITLYYKKGVPIVYSLRDASAETGKAAEEQTEISLDTVKNWKKRPVRLRDILEDLVASCSKPFHIKIENPFAVDREYFNTMCDKPEIIQYMFPRSSHIISCPEQVSLLAAVTSGALLSVLGEYFVSSPTDAKLVFEDISFLSEFHFNHSLMIGMKD